MFYCESCRLQVGWPRSLAISRGVCEICGLAKTCYDVHHSNLPAVTADDLAYLQRELKKEANDDMTEHDRIRMERAKACDRNDLESLMDALRGLQSTDHPSLMPLHDELLVRYNELHAAKILEKERHDTDSRHHSSGD
jgi:hypothetical protein